MQREKLYNLGKTAYFIVAHFVFEADKILSVRKWHIFLVQAEFVFFLLHLFIIILCKLWSFHAASCDVFYSLKKHIR